MRLRLLLLVALVGLVGCGTTKRPTSEEGSAPIGKRVVVTDSLLLHGGSDTLRIGRLYSGEEAVVHFALENQSSGPLMIVGEELTCGCIALNYERKPVTQGEFLPVEMHFSSRGLYGWQLKLFYLRLYGSEHAMKFYVEAEVE